MAKEKFQKYVISLDAVDVSLLPISYHSKFDNVAPLWTRNNLDMRNDDYYEFEIKNVDAKLDDDPEDEIIKIPCHICNIDVPVPFLRQHIDSNKHTINMKIADMAVERLKKSMHHHSVCNEETHPTLHFCPACVTVIKLKDKTNHEKSIAHKNSLVVNKFLNDFYILYTNDTNCDDDGNLDENIDDINESNDRYVQRTNVVNDNVDRSIDSLSFKSATDSASMIKESDHDTSDKNKKNNDIKTIKEMKKVNNTSVNVFESVEDKATVGDASKETSSPIKKENIKKKKAKAKSNAGIAQDLVVEAEKILNHRQSSISSSSIEDKVTEEASKIDSEFIKVEKNKSKKAKKNNNQDIVQEYIKSIDFVSVFADEATKTKKSKTKINQEVVHISKEQKHNGKSVESLSFLGDYITVQDTSRNAPEVNKTENNKTKKSKNKQDILEISKQAKDKTRPTDSLFIVDNLTKGASARVLEISKTGKKQTDAQIRIKTTEKNETKRTDKEHLCKICNQDENKDHSVCYYLWIKLCERFDTDDEITDDFNDLHYHLVMKCNSPFCMVCKVNFYGDIDVIAHLLSEEHINRYKMLISEHYLTLDNDLTTCTVCDVKFKKEFELLHCEDIKHITKQEKYKRILSKTNA
ncbi:E3 ubiquitin-protein ligase RBBP6-like [Vanessa atalanta]|uniref:E3 ubiquitin-protein ligase RBBP6-like n=1 Tax=Vanessa atalanta TaxID=42275 RepID=UPI001FCD78B2|nr:E3 ubiquitin-protein ligase RBBP6-like [Vanessa atalanta]